MIQKVVRLSEELVADMKGAVKELEGMYGRKVSESAFIRLAIKRGIELVGDKKEQMGGSVAG